MGGDWSEAWAASADGSLVVGWAEVAPGDWHAFRWSAQSGMEDLNIVYAPVIPPRSILRVAFAISPDGRYIVGMGHNVHQGPARASLRSMTRMPSSGDIT
ncbi:MAG: hypothetical protein C4309_08800 [Chloroflexota bacterium]